MITINEYRFAYRCLNDKPTGDFEEGVGSLLIDKKKPEWSHRSVEDVDDKLIDSYFQVFSGEELNGLPRGELKI